MVLYDNGKYPATKIAVEPRNITNKSTLIEYSRRAAIYLNFGKKYADKTVCRLFVDAAALILFVCYHLWLYVRDALTIDGWLNNDDLDLCANIIFICVTLNALLFIIS